VLSSFRTSDAFEIAIHWYLGRATLSRVRDEDVIPSRGAGSLTHGSGLMCQRHRYVTDPSARVDARCCSGKPVAGTRFPFEPCCDFLDATATLLRFFLLTAGVSSIRKQSRLVKRSRLPVKNRAGGRISRSASSMKQG
jgi:hypothetical protein